MRAQIISGPGGAEAFQLREVDKPEAQQGQVLVRVRATSVNPIDIRARRDATSALTPRFPAILQLDFAGIVEAIAADVGGFSVGDEVYGYAGGVGGIPGALAEYMAADVELIAHKPKKLDFVAAAALPVVAVTAYQTLVERVRLSADDEILIHAGAGGVGHIAVQLAHHLGARVIATASSPEKAALARRFGADEVVDYRTQSVEEYVAEHTGGQGFPIVFDTVGGANLAASIAAIRAEGRVVTCQGRGTHDLTNLHNRGGRLDAVFALMPLLLRHGRPRQGERLRAIADLADAGAVAPLIDEVFMFDRTADAHRKLESGRAIGKVVVRID